MNSEYIKLNLNCYPLLERLDTLPPELPEPDDPEIFRSFVTLMLDVITKFLPPVKFTIHSALWSVWHGTGHY